MSTNNTFGMTDAGFKPKRLNDILQNIITKVQGITNPETGEKPLINETSDTIFGQFASIVAEELSVCWEQMYIAANMFDPLNNSGVALRGQVQINGITPSYGSYTQIQIEVSGQPGTVVKAGSIIANEDGTQTFTVDKNILLNTPTAPNQATGTGTATCQTRGVIDPDDNTVISIQTPIFGWSGVKNTNTISVGTNEDTDEELHVKQQRATSATSYRQVEAVYAGIVNVPGVIFARVYQNKTTAVDDRGIPAKTIAAVVVGGKDEDVGRAISLKVPMLSSFVGNAVSPYKFIDVFGEETTYQFYRPTEVPVKIEMTITITNSIYFPENAEDLIKQNIINYAAYGLSPSIGFPPGESVSRSRLYTPINEVAGFKVNTLKIGKVGSETAEQDIAIDWNEVASFDEDNITIQIVDG